MRILFSLLALLLASTAQAQVKISALPTLNAPSATFVYGIDATPTSSKVPVNGANGLVGFDASGNILPTLDNTGAFGGATTRWNAIWLPSAAAPATAINFSDGVSVKGTYGYTASLGPIWTDKTVNQTLRFNLQSITATRTVAWPDAGGTVTVLGNTATGTGNVVLASAPSIDSGTFTTAETFNGAASFTAAVTDSVNGAASTPPLFLTGTILTGGTGTTNFPNVLLQPTGTTPVTVWSTSGTGIGMNLASGFAGNFLDFHTNGANTQLFAVSSTGAVLSNSSITAGTSLGFKTVFQNSSNAHILESVTAPSIASGFGTSPSVVANNGTAAFTINVGTGGTASSGVVTMPAATTGWACNVTPNAAPQAGAIMFSAPTSTTSITITNYTLSTAAALAWPASAVLQVTCTAY